MVWQAALSNDDPESDAYVLVFDANDDRRSFLIQCPSDNEDSIWVAFSGTDDVDDDWQGAWFEIPPGGAISESGYTGKVWAFLEPFEWLNGVEFG